VGRKVVELDEGRPLACVTMGLFLVSDRERPLAVLVTHQRYPLQTPLVEVMAPEPQLAEAFIGATPTRFGRPGATSVADCFCTARPARARPLRPPILPTH
jgi:hypothetical protein